MLKKLLPTATRPQPRLDWLDVAKGYGIVMMIIGHLHFDTLKLYFYTCHMPLFFFLSGYVFRPYDSWHTFWRKKVRSLLIPYFFYGLVQLPFYFFYTVGWSKLNAAFVWGKIVDFLLQRRFWLFWFLTCLFLVEIVFYFLVHYLKNSLWLAAAVIALAVISLTYYAAGGKPLIWNLDAVGTALPFYYLGFLFRRLHLPVCRPWQRRAWCWFALLLLVDYLCLRTNQYFGQTTLEMYNSHYGFPPITYLGAVAGIGAIVIFSQFFTPRLIRYFGRHSLYYFAWHQKVFFPLAVSFLSLFPFLGEYKGLRFQTAELFLVLTSMTICCYLNELLRNSLRSRH